MENSVDPDQRARSAAGTAILICCQNLSFSRQLILYIPSVDEFDFKIVNFPFLDGDIPRPTSYVI